MRSVCKDACMHTKKPPMGIEPMTIRLRSACSTNWAKEAIEQFKVLDADCLFFWVGSAHWVWPVVLNPLAIHFLSYPLDVWTCGVRARLFHWGYGATVARLTPDQKVGSSNLSGLIFVVLEYKYAIPVNTKHIFGMWELPYIHTYLHAYMQHACMHICTHPKMHACMHQASSMYTCTYVCLCTYRHIHMCVCTSVCIYVSTYVHMYV